MHYVMFKSLHFLNDKEWHFFLFDIIFFFFFNMVKDYPFQINVINKLGQRYLKLVQRSQIILHKMSNAHWKKNKNKEMTSNALNSDSCFIYNLNVVDYVMLLYITTTLVMLFAIICQLADIFLFNTVNLCWHNLYCIKRYTNKGHLITICE